MATLYVGSEQAYKTIADAVKAAAAGDTIIVKGSEYTATDERVRVDKSLTLKAEGDVTLRGLNIGGTDFDLVVDGFTFVADEADASGATGYANNASCISQVGQLRNVTVENCTFDLTNAGMTRTYGMFLSLGAWGFENLVVRNNVCNGYYDEDGYSGYGLIYAANVQDADISNNTITYAASHAIQLSLTGTTYQGSGEQTVQINGNTVDKSYACAVYCADLHNSDMTVQINDNTISNVQEGSCSIYHGAIRIGQSTISGVEITGNIVEGAQVGIYNAAAIKEGSGGSIEISNNALAVSQIHPAEEGVTPEFSGLGGSAIPENTADKNLVVEGAEVPVDTTAGTIYVNSKWAADAEGSKVVAGSKVVVMGTNAFADLEVANAIARANKDTLVIPVGAEVTNMSGSYVFINTDPGETGAYYDLLTDEKNYSAEISGKASLYQIIWNNGDLAITDSAVVRTGEALRVMGGSLTIEGSRTAGDETEVSDLAPSHWGSNWTPYDGVTAQVAYFQLGLGATASITDANMVVTAGTFTTGWNIKADEVAATSLTMNNSYVVIGNHGSGGNSYVTVQNGSSLTLENGSTISQAYTTTNTHGGDLIVSIEDGSTVSMAGGSLLDVDQVVNAGVLKMDVASSISANTISGNGDLVVVLTEADIAGSVMKQIIDVKDGASFGSIAYVDANGEAVDGFYSMIKSDGDVWVTNADQSKLYVNSEWTGYAVGDAIADREGLFFGVNAFTTYTSAIQYISTWSDKKAAATIYVEKSDTKYNAGYVIAQPEEALIGGINPVYTGIETTIADGARLDLMVNNIKINYVLTVEAGGSLNTTRGNVSTAYLQSGGKLIAGEAGGERATVNLMHGTTKGYDLLTTWGNNPAGTINVANTDFTVRNLSLNGGTGTFTAGSVVTIQGALTANVKMTVVDSTVNVWGTHGRSGNSYFKEYNYLGNLEMTNSTMTIGDTNASTVTDKVVFKTVTLNGSDISIADDAVVSIEGTLKLLDGSSLEFASAATTKSAKITVSGGSVLSADVELQNLGSITLTEGGVVSAGTLTIGGYINFTGLTANTEYGFNIDGIAMSATTDANGKISVFTSALTNGTKEVTLFDKSTFVAVDKTVTVANGSMTMDADSSVEFTTLNAAPEAITLDTTGYTDGTKRVMNNLGADLTKADYEAVIAGDAALDATVGEAGKFIVANGDLYITDKDQSTLYVNGAYTEDSALAEGNILGYNAFNTMQAALDVLENGPATLNITGETADKTAAVTLTEGGEYVISGGNGNFINELFVLNGDKEITEDNRIGLKFDNADIAFSKFGEEKVDGKYFGNYDVVIEDSTVSGKAYATIGSDAAFMTVRGNSTFTVTNSLFGFDAGTSTAFKNLPVGAANTADADLLPKLDSGIQGVVAMAYGDDSVSEITGSTAAFRGFEVGCGADVTVDDSVIYLSGGMNIGAAYYGAGAEDKVAAVTVTNGSVVRDLEWGSWGGSMAPVKVGMEDAILGSALLRVEDGSVFAFSNYKNETAVEIGAKGAVEVEDATFETSALKINDGGSFTVSSTEGNASTLNIGTLTGTISATGTLANTTVGGSVKAEGDVTFVGKNNIDTFSFGWYNNTITIGKGASLVTNRSTLSYGNTLDVDGEIVDAKTANKEDLTASLNMIDGFSFTGNGTANGKDTVMDVDNAYVIMGSTSSKNSAATGNFVFDFNNSIVDINTQFSLVESTSASLTPKFTWTAVNSVFNVNGKIGITHSNATAEFDNSVITVSDRFKNAGVFTLKNGSKMSVGGNSDGPAFANIGNSGVLTVTDAGSEFDMVAATTGTYGFLNLAGGSVNVNNGGLFKVSKLENYENASLYVDGGIVSATAVTNKGEIIVEGTGASFTAGDVTNTGYITIMEGGSFSAADVTATSDNQYSNSVFVMEGSFTASGDMTNSVGSMSVYDGEFTVGGTLTNSGSITVENSVFTAGNLINSGSLSVDGGTFTVTGTLITGDGTYNKNREVFTVSGNVAFDIDEMTGYMCLKNVTLLESTIGSKGLQGSARIIAQGTVTVAGDVVIGDADYTKYARFGESQDVCDLYLADGKTLTVNGQFQWGAGTISGNGEVKANFIQFYSSTVKSALTARDFYIYGTTVIDGGSVTDTIYAGQGLQVTADLTVKNGGKLLATNGNQIWVGPEDSYYGTKGSLTVIGAGSLVSADHIAVRKHDGYVMTLSAGAEASSKTMYNNSEVTVADATVTVGTFADNGTFTAGAVTGKGTFTVSGTSSISGDFTQAVISANGATINTEAMTDDVLIAGATYGAGIFTITGTIGAGKVDVSAGTVMNITAAVADGKLAFDDAAATITLGSLTYNGSVTRNGVVIAENLDVLTDSFVTISGVQYEIGAAAGTDGISVNWVNGSLVASKVFDSDDMNGETVTDVDGSWIYAGADTEDAGIVNAGDNLSLNIELSANDDSKSRVFGGKQLIEESTIQGGIQVTEVAVNGMGIGNGIFGGNRIVEGATLTGYVKNTVEVNAASGAAFGGQVVGGSFVVEGTMSTIGTTSVAIGGADTAVYNAVIAGGSIVSNGSSAYNNGDSVVTIDNGIFNDSIYGGGYVQKNGQFRCTNTSITINGGEFNGKIYGGNGEAASCTKDNLTLVENNTSITINGGTFNANIYGGSFGLGKVNGSSTIEITGGVFGDILIDGDSSNAEFYKKDAVADRNLIFNGYDAALEANIRNFDTVKFLNDADIDMTDGVFDAAEVDTWSFENGASVVGLGDVAFDSEDTLEIYLNDFAADVAGGDSWTIMKGSSIDIADLDNVIANVDGGLAYFQKQGDVWTYSDYTLSLEDGEAEDSLIVKKGNLA